ncbi:C-terminal processing protease CtpA/Prc [Mangrovibacterium marinum]|uniref:C-terminal processing protease CtpA/Prc n=1 Tax=Mangrovibacterium marinum TaxID=1639118 RepID=A0A2T5C5Z5_9BACT|nr:S41 family peptidase [Mangrovibacterium marinum]PTN10302.1 C-terminal processing protease CtpA/Prc [Mangrovibacterium marinum]
MKHNFWVIQLFAGLLLLMTACEKDEETIVDGSDKIDAATLATNGWIKDNMETFYLWNDRMPDVDETQEEDPALYFEKLLYTDEDEWSWITDDYSSLAADFSGVPVTMGFEPAFYLFSDNTSVFIVVKYVYPNSPAEEAGLKRGDIILEIDNTAMTTDNYYDLYSGSSYSVQLGLLSGSSIGLSGASYDLTARVVSTDPSVYHTVLDADGTKVGYLAYVEFVAGDDDKFLSSMDEIFDDFKAEGIRDLVVDLRYNPGGEIDAASYLASTIAPASVVTNHETLINLQFNDDVQAAYEYYYPDELYYSFTDTTTVNMNLGTVYFLTTSGTASASELLITGLAPYMNVVQIGEATYGKYTGMYVLPDDNEEWCMLPVVMKYANANGYTDFSDGLQPDYEILDDLLETVPFGDPADPMLAQALSLITTGAPVATASVKSAKMKLISRELNPAKMELKRNLFVPHGKVISE